MTKLKTIGFRPTQEIKATLREYIEAHSKIKKESQAVIGILNDFPKLILENQHLKAMKKPSPQKESGLLSFPRLRAMPESPMINDEVNKLFMGKHSPFIEAICNLTPQTLERNVIIATKKGIIIGMPVSQLMTSTKEGG